MSHFLLENTVKPISTRTRGGRHDQDIAAGRISVENIQTELAETALSNWELEPAKSIIAVLELLGEHVPTGQGGE